MKQRFSLYAALLIGTLTILAGAAVSQPPVAAQPPDETARLKEAVTKLAAEKAELQAALAKAQQPMPVGAGGQPVKAPPVNHPRGYNPDPAALARAHAAARAKHDDRMKSLPHTTAPQFDCRTTFGNVLDIDDQGQCGDCFGVSMADCATMALVKAGQLTKKDRLSSQYGLDYQNCFQGGCNGGDEAQVADYIKSTGMPLTADYGPYTANPNRPKPTTGMKFYTIGDWGFCKGDQGQGVASVQEIKDAMVQYGPISVAFDASGCDNYSGGVMSGNGRNVDHAVLCIGWDDSKGAFLGMNQWGTSWGEAGFFWIKYGSYSWGTEAIWVSAATLPPPPATTVAVPNVVGSTLKNASDFLASAGLVYSGPVIDPVTLVTAQAPAAGTVVATGSTVTVTAAVVPPDPPPATGDITVRVPAGSPAGSYTAISDADAAAVKGHVSEIIKILTPNSPAPEARVPLFPPSGWVSDTAIAGQLKTAMEKQAGGAEAYRKVAGNGEAHPILMRMVYSKMRKDAAGQKLIREYQNGALPAGWLQGLLDWFVKNGPALMSLVLEIMKLFGLACVFPCGFGRLRRLHREMQNRLAL